ncbi:MAG: NAD(P)H-hydrate dehydratase [bacterium]|nr:NAD(P)H-hydrate dehydratase [bacterium]
MSKQNLSPQILKKIKLPQKSSHKGQNGILYIVAGSKQYHGALFYAISIASFFVDLIYVETDLSNRSMVMALKKLHPAIILVSAQQRMRYLKKSDCLLIGPGLGKTAKSRKTVLTLLKHSAKPEKVVIDADALSFIQQKQLTANMVITPHQGEYRELYGNTEVLEASKLHPAVILQKGAKDAICQNGKCKYNTRGNAGLTKGGTGDVLAGLVAVFCCLSDVYTASCAGAILNGLAAEDLEKRYGTYFSTQTLIQQIPQTFNTWLRK